MKRFVIYLVLLNIHFGNAQEDERKNSRAFFGYFGVGRNLVVPTDDNDYSLGINFFSNNRFGFGIEFTNSFYTPSDAIGMPSPSEVENFDGDSFPDGIETRRNPDSNRLVSFSPNINYTWKVNENKKWNLFFQMGPSIIYAKTIDYRITYSPGFSGGFGPPSFSGPRLNYEIENIDYDYLLGIFSKIATQISLSRRFGVVLSLNNNINEEKTVLGFQFGCIWGVLR